MKIKENSFVTLLPFMVTDLHLKGNELIIYAIIYGFSQLEQGVFCGSLTYLATWTNSSKVTVIETLKKLIEKNLIKKFEYFENGVKYCRYKALLGSKESLPLVNNFNGGSKETLTGVVKNFNGGSKETLHNNIDYMINNNIENNIDREPEKKKSTSFQKPTVDEVKAYCEERGNTIDPEKFIDYYNSNGWKVGKSSMKDWKATIRNWERNEKERNKPKLSPSMNDPDKLFF